jgi:hypothetical protein
MSHFFKTKLSTLSQTKPKAILFQKVNHLLVAMKLSKEKTYTETHTNCSLMKYVV